MALLTHHGMMQLLSFISSLLSLYCWLLLYLQLGRAAFCSCIGRLRGRLLIQNMRRRLRDDDDDGVNLVSVWPWSDWHWLAHTALLISVHCTHSWSLSDLWLVQIAGAGPSWAESRAIVQSPDQEPRSCSSASGLKDNLSDPMIHLELCQDISRPTAQREPQIKQIFLRGLSTPGTKACLNLTTKSSWGKLSN